MSCQMNVNIQRSILPQQKRPRFPTHLPFSRNPGACVCSFCSGYPFWGHPALFGDTCPSNHDMTSQPQHVLMWHTIPFKGSPSSLQCVARNSRHVRSIWCLNIWATKLTCWLTALVSLLSSATGGKQSMSKMAAIRFPNQKLTTDQ